MTKYLVIYTLPAGSPNPREDADPATEQTTRASWGRFLADAADAVVDMGFPTSPMDGSAVHSERTIGFSIFTAESDDALRDLLAQHPHGLIGGFVVHRADSPPVL